jgi:hypothetical protein|tara:strand:- start:529 stop:1236 length:708 start_codon:yes stop_codon:yes gene_type:complete
MEYISIDWLIYDIAILLVIVDKMSKLNFLEGRVFGNAHTIMIYGCRARLGHELLKLVESPKTKIQVSPREEGGLGMDSDLPNPFFIPKDAGDYRKWTLFGLDSNTPHIDKELVQRITYFMSEESIKALRENGINKQNMSTTIYGSASTELRSGRKNQVKIQALMSDKLWRDHAKKFNVQLLKSAQSLLSEIAEILLEELDDIKDEKRVVGSSQPVLDDLERLFQVYAEEMSITLD